MTKILRTKPLAETFMQHIISAIAVLPTPPELHVVLVGDNAASHLYVKYKQEAAQKANITCTIHYLPADINQKTLENFLQNLNNSPEVTGIILQLPLPSQLNQSESLNIITPEKDIDGLTYHNQQALNTPNAQRIIPATPLAIMRILNWAETPLTNVPTVILGESKLVGAPTAILLKQAGANVTTFNSTSPEAEKNTALKQADIIVSATGQRYIIKPEHIKAGVTLIDVGIVRDKTTNQVTGDISPDVISTAGALTPVPGGVGPMTIISLLTNTLDAAYQQHALPKPDWNIPTR